MVQSTYLRPGLCIVGGLLGTQQVYMPGCRLFAERRVVYQGVDAAGQVAESCSTLFVAVADQVAESCSTLVVAVADRVA